MFLGAICYKKQGVAAMCYNHFWAFAICYILLNGLCYMLLHTPWGALLLDTHVISGGMAGVRLFEPDEMISCMQLPCLCALLSDSSVLDVWAGRVMSNLVCFH